MHTASLNHTYRLVWSEVTQSFVAVAETAKGRGKRSRNRRLLAAAALMAVAGLAQAQLPVGGQIVAGQGSIAQSGSTLTVTQGSDRMAADWQSFSIGQGHTVNFTQPSASAVALNRVLGSDVSIIQGALNANGQVFLINPNGVLFSPSAQVNVGGMVASTLNLGTADFMAGKYTFEGAGSNAIINQGNITTHGNGQGGGTIALIAARIENTGNLSAHAGHVLIGAGSRVTLDLGGPVKLQVEQGAIDALVEQGGAIKADGGLVYLSAKAAGELVSTVINHTGITEAQTLATGKTGEIYLMGDMRHGRIEVAGTLDASAPNVGDGGFIETSAAVVQIQPDLAVSTRAAAGKTGHWLIDPFDFAVSSSGGNITGTALSGLLANNSITIQTANPEPTGTTTTLVGSAGTNGDIFVNDSITWSSGHTLTLDAWRNIEINAPINASAEGGGKLALEYGQGAQASGNTATYTINAPVSLKAGQNFSTTLGNDGTPVMYRVVRVTNDVFDDFMENISLNMQIALGGDINLSGVTWASLGTSWNSSFYGKLEGLGNTIRNVTVTTGEPSDWEGFGFFGVINNATIQNLRLDNVKVDLTGNTLVASDRAAGALAGYSFGNSVIRNVQVSGSTIKANNALHTGGLLGYLGNGVRIESSSANAQITSEGNNVGGLVGFNEGGMISRSWSGGSVLGESQVGGLVGKNSGNIEDAYSIASVRGGEYETGGLVGWNTNLGTINRTWASGQVDGYEDHGGLVGWNSGAISHSFWDGDTSEQDSGIGGGTADNTTMLRSITNTINAHTQTTYTDFDFTNTWWMAPGATRPFLRSEWRQNITNAHELQLVSIKPALGYVLANDLYVARSVSSGPRGLFNPSEMWRGVMDGDDFRGSWSPIASASTPFSGTFDGNGKSIYNLRINTNDSNKNYGLFDTVSNGKVNNLRLSDGSVTYIGGSTPSVGALAGKVLGGSLIDNVQSTLSVTGHNNVGGLVGSLEGSDADHLAVIQNSSSDGNVIATASAGGLIGDARYFSITDSRATGAVEAEYYVGGLVGYASNGGINSSRATGPVVSEEEAGGLVGTAVGMSITDSYATGDVTSDAGGYLMGGLVGLAESDTTITGSYATGNVSVSGSAGKVGGLVGYAASTSIAQSYATGAVTVGDSSSDVGGLIGLLEEAMSEADHSLKEAYATGDITAGNNAQNIGGLVGQFEAEYVGDNYIRYAFATGKVTTGDNSANIGGLVGLLNGGALNRTYAAGLVSAGNTSTGVGGLVGALDPSRNPATLWAAYSFWDTTTSGQSSSAGGTGKTTAEMNLITTFNSGASNTRWSFEIDEARTADYPALKMDGSGKWLIKPQAGGGGTGGDNTDTGTGGGNPANNPRINTAITAAQSAKNTTLGQITTPTGTAFDRGLKGAGLARGMGPGSEPGVGGGTPMTLSGGLAFVDVQGAGNAVEPTTISNGQRAAPGGQAPSESAGRDTAGFMRVFVVNGGINLPDPASDAAAQNVGGQNGDAGRNP